MSIARLGGVVRIAQASDRRPSGRRARENAVGSWGGAAELGVRAGCAVALGGCVPPVPPGAPTCALTERAPVVDTS
ncbi:MAG TPA: hypothetical protein PKA64_23240, partial [Myxococcota bacterium]|nr:hypothetical protein [Myxococcota bacterium]